MKNSRILGVGSYLPENILKNEDLRKFMDTSDEWIQQRTGIKQRHWIPFDSSDCTSDLALRACEKAIASAGIKKEDLDMIILATLSRDHEFPGTACFLQDKLGVPGIPALDVRQQCTGFIYGLSIADQFIKTGMYKTVLVVGAETHSKGIDISTRGRDVSVLFGDGAGAVVLGATDGPLDKKSAQIFSTHLHADGKYARELWIEAPTMAKPGVMHDLKHFEQHSEKYFPAMNGKTVFMHAVKRMPEVLMEALTGNGFSLEDVDLFLFHQANLRINEMVAKQMGIPAERIFNTIDRFGNTTAATIPLGMDTAIKEGKLKKGM
ncbi:MAG: 3-oxoacyl-ACP synthase III family protein, partial [Bdellovibrionota bacterium]